MNTASTNRAPEPTAPNPGAPRQQDLPRGVQPPGANEEPGPVESEDDIPRDEGGSTGTTPAHHALRAVSRPVDGTQRQSETYTPHRSYTPPSSDELGPVESEDDIPREDNDTPRE